MKDIMSLHRLIPRMGSTSIQLTPADEMLRARLIRQAVVLGPLPIAIYVAAMSTDFRKQWLSVNAARVTGFSPEAFIRRPRLWVSRLHADDRPQVLKEYRRLADGTAHTTEYRWRTANGAYRWFLDAAMVLRDTPGLLTAEVWTLCAPGFPCGPDLWGKGKRTGYCPGPCGLLVKGQRAGREL